MISTATTRSLQYVRLSGCEQRSTGASPVVAGRIVAAVAAPRWACYSLAVAIVSSLALAQDRPPTAKATAPADHVLVRSEIGGAYFVSRAIQAQRADLE